MAEDDKPSITQMEPLTPEQLETFRKEGLALARRLEPRLKGKNPNVTAVCLAELVSMWAAGHVIPGDAEATKAIRTAAVTGWSQLMLGLLPVNAKIIDEQAAKISKTGRA